MAAIHTPRQHKKGPRMNFLPTPDALLSSRQRNTTALTVRALSDGTVATVDSYAKPTFDDIIDAASPPDPASMWLFNVAADWSIAEAILRLQFPALRVHVVFDLVDDQAFLRRVLQDGALTLTTVRRPERPLPLVIATDGLGAALMAADGQTARTPKAGMSAPDDPMLAAKGYRAGILTVNGCAAGTSNAAFFSGAGNFIAEVDAEGGYIRVSRWPVNEEEDVTIECVTIDLAPHRFRNLAAKILKRTNLRIALKPLGATIECDVQMDELAGDLRCSIAETTEELAESVLPIVTVRGRTVVLDAATKPGIAAAIAGGTSVESGFTYGWTKYIAGRHEPFAYFVLDFAGGDRLAVHLDAPSRRAALTEIAQTGTLVLATTANPHVARPFPVDVEFVRDYLGSADPPVVRTS